MGECVCVCGLLGGGGTCNNENSYKTTTLLHIICNCRPYNLKCQPITKQFTTMLDCDIDGGIKLV